MGYEIKFLYAHATTRLSVDGKDEIVKGLEGGRLQGARRSRPPSRTAPRCVPTRTPTINVRSAGWCSDWPSGCVVVPAGASSRPTSKTEGLGTNYAAFSEKAVDKQIAKIQALADRGAAGRVERARQGRSRRPTSRCSSPVTTVSRMMHGSNDQRLDDDTVLGMPTWKDIVADCRVRPAATVLSMTGRTRLDCAWCGVGLLSGPPHQTSTRATIEADRMERSCPCSATSCGDLISAFLVVVADLDDHVRALLPRPDQPGRRHLSARTVTARREAASADRARSSASTRPSSTQYGVVRQGPLRRPRDRGRRRPTTATPRASASPTAPRLEVRKELTTTYPATSVDRDRRGDHLPDRSASPSVCSPRAGAAPSPTVPW